MDVIQFPDDEHASDLVSFVLHLETTVGVSLPWVDAAIDTLGEPAELIMGRAMTVDQLLDALVEDPDQHDFLPETNEDEVRAGRLGRYRGCTLIRKIDFAPDELWIVGSGDKPRVAVITDLSLRSIDEPTAGAPQ